jgi:hypothetical protein
VEAIYQDEQTSTLLSLLFSLSSLQADDLWGLGRFGYVRLCFSFGVIPHCMEEATKWQMAFGELA